MHAHQSGLWRAPGRALTECIACFDEKPFMVRPGTCGVSLCLDCEIAALRAAASAPPLVERRPDGGIERVWLSGCTCEPDDPFKCAAPHCFVDAALFSLTGTTCADFNNRAVRTLITCDDGGCICPLPGCTSAVRAAAAAALFGLFVKCRGGA